jgi:hypothetical protein
MDIESKYATFGQAKWLKGIGFGVTCDSCYVEDWSKERLPDSLKEKVLSNPHTVKGIKSNNSDKNYISRPEQWVVVEWLLLNHGIWVHTAPENNEEDVVKWAYVIQRICEEEVFFVRRIGEFNSPQEAYSVAFDYIKENNLI